jgi:broad specificity phosphatase PhoE
VASVSEHATRAAHLARLCRSHLSDGMRIVLVRHGKPGSVDTSPIRGHDVGKWVREYNNVGITRDLAPAAPLLELVSSTRCVVASHLRRARESAAWLAPPTGVRIDPELYEAALPESLGLSLRLSPGAWVVLARVAWWLNWCEPDRLRRVVELCTRRYDGVSRL